MSPDEMRAQSANKVKQVMELMKVLHIRVEARERITPEGFVEKVIFWIDEEKYPEPEKKPIPSLEEKGTEEHA